MRLSPGVRYTVIITMESATQTTPPTTSVTATSPTETTASFSTPPRVQLTRWIRPRPEDIINNDSQSFRIKKGKVVERSENAANLAKNRWVRDLCDAILHDRLSDKQSVTTLAAAEIHP